MPRLGPYFSPPDGQLVADELRNLAAGVNGVLGVLGNNGIPLPPDNDLTRRQTALEELAVKVLRRTDPLDGTPISSTEKALIVLALDRAIREQTSKLGELGTLSPNPEVTQVPRQRLSRIQAISAWPAFKGIGPAPHIGLGSYLDKAALEKLNRMNAAVLRSAGLGDGPEAYDRTGNTSDRRRQINRDVQGYLEQHDTSSRKLRRKIAKIRDRTLRAILRRDFIQAVESICIEHWKPAFILAGTVIEAVLQERLDLGTSKVTLDAAFGRTFPNGKGTPPALRDYKLHQLIEVSAELGLVGKIPARLLHGVRDVRNFVHAHVEAKQGVTINRRLATAAVNTMFDVIELL